MRLYFCYISLSFVVFVYIDALSFYYSGFQLSEVHKFYLTPSPLLIKERGGFSGGEVLSVFHPSEKCYIVSDRTLWYNQPKASQHKGKESFHHLP